MKITSFSRLYALMLLSKSPRHGYEIIKELEGAIGKKPSAADVYPFLKDLMDQGYVEVGRTGKREMKKYVLTGEGKKFTKKILENLSKIIDAMIASKVTSCAHCSCKVYGDAYYASVKGRKAPFCCRYCAGAAGSGRSEGSL
ncbi:PadR family transcriptional regulator [Candidatus Micrarchaeota archaeon]|nr:PadR family transcriptional regulator [Candidatus Micrarchaeota archaeon]